MKCFLLSGKEKTDVIINEIKQICGIFLGFFFFFHTWKMLSCEDSCNLNYHADFVLRYMRWFMVFLLMVSTL